MVGCGFVCCRFSFEPSPRTYSASEGKMKNKNVKYNCSSCNDPVYRVGKGTNLSLKLCGKCSKKQGVTPVPVSNEIDLPEPEPSNITIASKTELQKTVADFLMKYRAMLNRVEKLAEEHPNETPLSLWHRCRSLSD